MEQTQKKPQHMVALERANEVRLARAALKRSVADGTRTVGQIVLSSPWEAESMPIAELLISQRRWGARRVERFLGDLGITETKTIGSMTDRQRRMLSTML